MMLEIAVRHAFEQLTLDAAFADHLAGSEFHEDGRRKSGAVRSGRQRQRRRC